MTNPAVKTPFRLLAAFALLSLSTSCSRVEQSPPNRMELLAGEDPNAYVKVAGTTFRESAFPSVLGAFEKNPWAEMEIYIPEGVPLEKVDAFRERLRTSRLQRVTFREGSAPPYDPDERITYWVTPFTRTTP
jgi:hypothetical protein